MAIQVGETIPTVTLKHLTEDGMQEISTDAVFPADQTVVLFAVPGAFTPTCSLQHLPGFITQADALKAKGVDAIVCMAVNDPFVMKEWGKQSGADDTVMMLPDGNGEFTRALGLEMDGTGYGLGERSKRFAMVVKNGAVASLAVEDGGGLTVSSAESVLESL